MRASEHTGGRGRLGYVAPVPDGLLAIRADGSPTIGTGHIARGIALAQRWITDGGDAVLVSLRLPEPLIARAERWGVDVVAAPEGAEALTATLRALAPKWTSLDGYDFGVAEQRAVREAGSRLLFIDDHGSASRYESDLVLDQNLGADPVMYLDRPVGSLALLGPRYALLRREFWQGARSARSASRRVLLTFGGFGSDDLNTLRSTIERRVGGDMELVIASGDVDDMASLMRTCDLAVSAAGSTVWELAATGVPMVLVPVAANQRPVAQALAAAGAAVVFEMRDPEAVADAVLDLLGDEPERTRLVRAASGITDGDGSRRVVASMDAVALSVRRAKADDAKLLWEWANDPVVRSASVAQEQIPWEAHLRWLDERLRSPTTWFFVGELNGRPVGQVRFDLRSDGAAEIGLSVAAQHRHRSIGAHLLARATAAVLDVARLDHVIGLVRPENMPSARAFEAARFLPDGIEIRGGVELRRFRLAPEPSAPAVERTS